MCGQVLEGDNALSECRKERRWALLNEHVYLRVPVRARAPDYDDEVSRRDSSPLQSSTSLMRSCFRSYQVWEPAAHNVLWWGTKDGEKRREKERERLEVKAVEWKGWRTPERWNKKKKKKCVNDQFSSMCLYWCLCLRGSLCVCYLLWVKTEFFIISRGT